MTLEFPKALPSSRESREGEMLRERKRVCFHHCGKEGWSPREIGLHQFLLITQSFCYVALVAKSVEGSHMVKRGKKKKKKQKFPSPGSEEKLKHFSPVLLGCQPLSA